MVARRLFLVLAANIDNENHIIKFPDSEPDSGYGELAHVSQMSQHMGQTVLFSGPCGGGGGGGNSFPQVINSPLSNTFCLFFTPTKPIFFP